MHRSRFRRVVIPATLLGAGCGSGGTSAAASARRAAALDEVVRAERAFAALASDSTVQHAFTTWLAPGGILFRPGPVSGTEALADRPMPPDRALLWEPAYADVSAAGDLGYTTGPWRSGRRGTRPDSLPGAGQYVTLWRNTPAGFRFVLDMGVAHAPHLVDMPADLVLADAPEGSVPAGPASPDQARDALLIADQDLGQVLTDGAAYRSYATDGVRVLRSGSGPAVGPDALIAASPPFPVESVPDGAAVAESTDLGYTWGRVLTLGNPERGMVAYYLRIWRRQGDGSWKLTLDLVSEPPG